MKKRIGTIKGKPIVEGGGGSNIIKKNEISINDIGSSSDSSDSTNDDDIQYFGVSSNLDSSSYDLILFTFPLRKIGWFIRNPAEIHINDPNFGTPDSQFFIEIGGNINNKSIYTNGNWYSIKEYLEGNGLTMEILKPISKEDFYRIDYTQEEAEKIKQDYYNHYLQSAPSEP